MGFRVQEEEWVEEGGAAVKSEVEKVGSEGVTWLTKVEEEMVGGDGREEGRRSSRLRDSGSGHETIVYTFKY